MNATEQFAHLPDVSPFDFYYLADAEHYPDRGLEWTELYWGPAGLGWMVSNIAPVYRADDLVAVTGIDITLKHIVEGTVGLQVDETGFAFLISGSGQAVTFRECVDRSAGGRGVGDHLRPLGAVPHRSC